MKMRKLSALVLSLGMATALAVTACGGGTTKTTEGKGAKETTAKPAVETKKEEGKTTEAPAGKTTEIVWWAFPTFGVNSGYEQELANAFMAANKDVKIKVETIDFQSGPDALTSAITAGTAPDVLFDAPGRIIEYGNAGNLVALDDMIGKLKGDLTSESLLETCKGQNGSYYMYPISSSPFYMGLNKEMLEKADALKYVNLKGDRTWTTDNFVKLCEALRDAGVCMTPGIVYCGGQGGDQGTRALVNNLYSSSIVGKDGKWNISDKGIKALELLKKMYDEKAIDAGFSMAAADELQQFQQETCAMTFCWGTSNAVSYKSNDFTQISVPFPSDDGKPELEYLVNGFCVFDNKDAARAEASKRFISFICDDATWGPKSVLKTGAFPVRASFGDLYKGNEEMSLLASWSKYYGPYYNTHKGFAAMRPLWFNMLQQVFNGTPAKEAAEAFNKGANGAK